MYSELAMVMKEGRLYKLLKASELIKTIKGFLKYIR
mgnify:CR=1 FL=1